MVTLRGVTWEHERGEGSVVAATVAYATVAPGVKIEWEARTLQQFADQPLEELVEDHDLLVIDHPHIPHAVEQGLLAPLDDYLPSSWAAADFVGRSHETYQHQGGQYGLATDAAAQVAVYRPDLLPEPPRTWTEVLELARQGKVLWPAKPIDAFSSLSTVCAGLGGSVMASPEQFVERDVFEPAWELLTELAGLVPEANLDQNPINVADQLATSDRWSYAPLLFGYTNYCRSGYRPHRLRYIDIPTFGHDGQPRGALLGGAGIAVSSRTRHLPEAAAFAVWLAEPDTQRGPYFDGGGQPGHRAAWTDSRLNELTLDFFAGTRRTLELAYVRPRHSGFIGLQDEASPWVTTALREEWDGTDLADRLDEATRRHLGGENSADR